MRSRSLSFAVSILVAICGALALATLLRAGDKSSKDAAARAKALTLFQKALAVSDIRAPGSPPFELQGKIDVRESSGAKAASGTYLLKWAAPDKWREEIHFPNYFRIRIGSKDGYFQSRNISYEVEPVCDLSAALGFLRELHVWARQSSIAGLHMVNIHQRKVGGAKADCVTLLRNDDKYGAEYCFDVDKGLLLRSGDDEFSGFTSVGRKLFPGKILVKGASSTTVQLKLSTAGTRENINDADFQPAANATTWASCDNPDELARVRHYVIPEYPIGARRAHVQGTVVVYGMVGADGKLHDLQVLNNPNISLTKSVLSALNGREYEPEICHGAAVSTEEVLRVAFTLGD